MDVIPLTKKHKEYNDAMEGRHIDQDRVYFNRRLRKHLVVSGCHSEDGAILLCEEWDVEQGDLARTSSLIYYGCERTELWPTEIKT